MLTASTLLAFGVAGVARAQDPIPLPENPLPEDPGQTCTEITQQSVGCDTEFTPVAKDGEELFGWKLQAGAKFGEEEAVEGSSTPLTVDFFGTDFLNEESGLFVGAQCTEEVAFDGLDGCARVPAIYRYSVDPDRGSQIEQVLGPDALGADQPGYIAAVAWIAPGKAIAVGGTGHFPRRELKRRGCAPVEGAPEGPSCAETDEEYAARDLAGEEPNASGRARVWVMDSERFGDATFRELQDIPPDANGELAHGLTALDCSPRRATDGDLCLMGGYRQVYRWRNGVFEQSFTPGSTNEQGQPTVEGGQGWRFRVRAIRFRAGATVDAGKFQAIAATSGCCASASAQNTPRFLLFYDQTARVSLLQGIVPGVAEPQEEVLSRQSLPDSYYALSASNSGTGTVIASPGAPLADADAPADEPASRLITLRDFDAPVNQTQAASCFTGSIGSGGYGTDLISGNLCSQIVNPKVSDLRLVAGDGDFDSDSALHRPDGLMDWAVGELRSSGQAAGYTTLRYGKIRASPTQPNPLTCDPLEFTVECEPKEGGEITAATKSQSLYRLPAYALNALSYSPDGAVVWAAGDKGAILRLGGEGSVSRKTPEPDPASVGSKQQASLPNAAPYQGLAPASDGVPGEVPDLAAQPTEKLPEPRLLDTGLPNPRDGADDSVRAIVMSRDGSEGWAFGGTATAQRQGTIFHFDGHRWQSCETTGIPGQTAPDPACDDLAFLQKADPPVQINTVARVPLERDSDPSNDDEFELVALGSSYKPAGADRDRQIVLRYHDGRWTVDEQGMRELGPTPGVIAIPLKSIVFTTPDDGWVAGAQTGGRQLFRFEDGHWIRCESNRAACDDDAGLLPLGAPGITNLGLYLAQAGSRIYLAGTRPGPGIGGAGTSPFVYWLDTAAEDPAWTPGYNPSCADPPVCTQLEPNAQGRVFGLAVGQDEQGRAFGWATGRFGGLRAGGGGVIGSENLDRDAVRRASLGTQAGLLRLGPGEEEWQPYSGGDAADDYLLSDVVPTTNAQPYIVPGPDGGDLSFIGPPRVFNFAQGPLLFHAGGKDGSEDGRWRAFQTPFSPATRNNSARWKTIGANVQQMAPDGRGGAWLAAQAAKVPPGSRGPEIVFYHLTDEAPKPVFKEAPHPVREVITDLAPGPGGQIWLATESNAVYRYDRVAGWDRATIPGWDRGSVVTRVSAARAVAVGENGEGVVVGERGRIANLSPSGVRLDAATGAPLCDLTQIVLPCGTGRDLEAAAVAPDGSALVGGTARALLYRPAGGAFALIQPPSTAASATITAIAMPDEQSAWFTTDTGQVFAGERTGERTWTWTVENRSADGQLITLDAGGQGIPLHDLVVDISGHGYAVGEDGLVIERLPGSTERWRRLDIETVEDFYSVGLPQGGGAGALIGGGMGMILTYRDGRFEIAREGQFTDPLRAGIGTENSARIVGLALSPGVSDGQVEAWAALQSPSGLSRPPAQALLHYTNASGESLLNPAGPTAPLPDSKPVGPGELSFAAFGRSDCHLEEDKQVQHCIEPEGTNFVNEVIPRRISEEIDSADGADFALFTGDVNRAAGRDQGDDTPLDVDVMHRRWVEIVGRDFANRGIPLYGALGGQDLSQANSCPAVALGRCFGTRQVGGAGTSGPWRQAMAEMPEPWGSSDPTSRDDLSFDPVDHADSTSAMEEAKAKACEAAEGADALNSDLCRGDTRTHYALDIKRGGATLARLAVIDTSLRSLQASDPNQNPLEAQLGWLDGILSSRPAGSRAIVLSNTPTYSYGPGALTDTNTVDGTQLEAILLENQASLLVSGRLGWNGLYYVTAPGLHQPCPGDSYPAGPPTSATPTCGGPADEVPDPAGAAGETRTAACEIAEGAGAPGLAGCEGTGGGLLGRTLTAVVTSGAGGTFGPDGTTSGSASDGFWSGYAMIHLDPETGEVRVEQRPIFDWIGIRVPPQRQSQATHVLRASKKLDLEGFGREAPGADEELRYDEIKSHAITHRYDLLVADPDRPWLPKDGTTDDDCDPYDCLDPTVGQVNRTTGLVSAGKGNYPRTYALAQLSVADQSATYPLTFEPRASFRTPPPPPRLPVAVPPPPPPATQPPQPSPPAIEPIVPVVPPPLAAASPPPPPAPPAPPTFASQAPLDLNLNPAALDVAAPTTVTQPPTPPVNPAPPSGARREARQRQAAAQKSGADSGEEGSGESADPGEAQVRSDPVDSPNQSASGLETGRERHPFTASAEREQPSAWARDLQWGGGLVLMALILTGAWLTLRPTPRRREPEIPAPAWARRRDPR
jgi:hypothetical protein